MYVRGYVWNSTNIVRYRYWYVRQYDFCRHRLETLYVNKFAIYGETFAFDNFFDRVLGVKVDDHAIISHLRLPRDE